MIFRELDDIVTRLSADGSSVSYFYEKRLAFNSHRLTVDSTGKRELRAPLPARSPELSHRRRCVSLEPGMRFGNDGLFFESLCPVVFPWIDTVELLGDKGELQISQMGVCTCYTLTVPGMQELSFTANDDGSLVSHAYICPTVPAYVKHLPLGFNCQIGGSIIEDVK